MKQMSTLSFATRLNALAAAAVVTLTLLSGIDSMAIGQGAAPQMAQAQTMQPA